MDILRSRILFLILLLCFGLVLIPLNALAQSFSDVPESYPNYKAIEYLKEKGVVKGYEVKDSADFLFKPDQEIIRAEALKMILASLEVDISNITAPSTYSDVTAGQWFHPYIMKASELKIVSGYNDGTFKPGQNLTLAESLKMLFVAAKVDLDSFANIQIGFSDVPADSWYAPYVRFAQTKNIVIGMDDGLMHPTRNITRAQLATIIYRLQKVKSNNNAPYNLAGDWPSFEHPYNNYKVNYPSNWTVEKYDDTTVFWKKTSNGDERFFSQDPLNSTYAAIYQDSNAKELSKEDYFQGQIALARETKSADVKFSQGTIRDLSWLKLNYPDNRGDKWFFYLPNKQILIAFVQLSQAGTGYRDSVLIDALLHSITYVEKAMMKGNDVLSVVRENILVEGKGKEMIGLLPDAQIIETDTIGVGTGPVDYYYSAAHDQTLKYERSADLLLDMKKGRGTDF